MLQSFGKVSRYLKTYVNNGEKKKLAIYNELEISVEDAMHIKLTLNKQFYRIFGSSFVLSIF